MHKNLFTDEQREEIKTIVQEALVSFFKENGNAWINFLIKAGMSAAAITAIIVAFQTIGTLLKIR